MKLEINDTYELDNPHGWFKSVAMASAQLANATRGCDCDALWGGKRRYGFILNWLLALDQLGNALSGGHPQETISSRLGRRKYRSGGKLTWHQPLSKLIDSMLELVDDNHSKEAVGC